MVSTAFGTILQELGKSMVVPIPDLQPDRNNSCLIKLGGGVDLQLEPDKAGENLIIACDLGAVPPGRYRENIFREALKANGLPEPRWGDFAYSKRTDHLLLIATLSFRDLNGEKVADYLPHFIEKVNMWREALGHSEVPAITAMKAASKLGGMFGLK